MEWAVTQFQALILIFLFDGSLLFVYLKSTEGSWNISIQLLLIWPSLLPHEFPGKNHVLGDHVPTGIKQQRRSESSWTDPLWDWGSYCDSTTGFFGVSLLEDLVSPGEDIRLKSLCRSLLSWILPLSILLLVYLTTFTSLVCPFSLIC